MPTPSLLLVRIRLLDPAFATSHGWATWTKLHFADLLSLGPASVNATSQFLNLAAPTEEEEGKKAEEARFPYFNIIEVGDLGVLTSKPYLELSRAKDLAGKREEGEAMIWDVADARFAAYEGVGGQEKGVGDEKVVRESSGEGRGDDGAGAEMGEFTTLLPFQDSRSDMSGRYEIPRHRGDLHRDFSLRRQGKL
ncbi:uncharacterized protein BDZ99DRAFT_394863 [Mytilinidion resinicola]|uniref:Uncharacterized protein n=1 Tax=Mytilinidion resinicola TaxID=574789 RepID=A0A6A6YDL2_9PEZI|nr:uncharacterized protein BDZ99DRAFT_394863 [Mytilinidion resinicola]KAF2806084.1 hypothetical protein BDZ99DRAFT_394863 [Mytilinidion resinicola]